MLKVLEAQAKPVAAPESNMPSLARTPKPALLNITINLLEDDFEFELDNPFKLDEFELINLLEDDFEFELDNLFKLLEDGFELFKQVSLDEFELINLLEDDFEFELDNLFKLLEVDLEADPTKEKLNTLELAPEPKAPAVPKELAVEFTLAAPPAPLELVLLNVTARSESVLRHAAPLPVELADSRRHDELHPTCKDYRNGDKRRVTELATPPTPSEYVLPNTTARLTSGSHHTAPSPMELVVVLELAAPPTPSALANVLQLILTLAPQSNPLALAPEPKARAVHKELMAALELAAPPTPPKLMSLNVTTMNRLALQSPAPPLSDSATSHQYVLYTHPRLRAEPAPGGANATRGMPTGGGANAADAVNAAAVGHSTRPWGCRHRANAQAPCTVDRWSASGF